MTKTAKVEKRYLHCETKFVADESGAIKGIAWPWSSDRGGDEIVRSGVKIDRDPVPILYGHNGTTIVGLAHLPITDAGIELDGRLLHEDIEKAKELRSLAKAGLQLSLSIGFIPNRFEFKKGGGVLYTDVVVVECSVVAVGQHAGAHLIEVRTQKENGGQMASVLIIVESRDVDQFVTRILLNLASCRTPFMVVRSIPALHRVPSCGRPSRPRRSKLSDRPVRTEFPHCFQCDTTYSATAADNARFCSQRCQDAFDRDVPRSVDTRAVTYRWRDGRPMWAGSGGFHIQCAGCEKEFISKGLRCCSPECQKRAKEKKEIAAITAEIGAEPINPRKHCETCGDRIPRFRNGRAVKANTRFCSPACARKSKVAPC